MYLVFSCSLNPGSRSHGLAERAVTRLQARDVAAELIDLRQEPLPLCDGNAAFSDVAVQQLGQRIANARGVLIASPVYNFDVSAATKNLVELTGKAWTGKVVGMLLAAGGAASYMSALGLANSLMLDFRCLILPRFVYAAAPQFEGADLADPDAIARIDELAGELVRVGDALAPE